MIDEIGRHSSEIAALCRRYGVERLDLFGSAADGTFDASTSDIDLLVTFRPEAQVHAFDNYFGLREALTELLGRKVDLVTAAQLRNRYLQQEIEASRRVLYAA